MGFSTVGSLFSDSLLAKVFFRGFFYYTLDNALSLSFGFKCLQISNVFRINWCRNNIYMIMALRYGMFYLWTSYWKMTLCSAILTISNSHNDTSCKSGICSIHGRLGDFIMTCDQLSLSNSGYKER